MSDELLNELKRLRKGRGIELSKIAGCPALMDLGGGDPQATYALIRDAVYQLGDDTKARALRAALALDSEWKGDLTQRRSDYGQSINRSSDTVENYENAMLDELSLMLSGKPASRLELDAFMYVKVAGGVVDSVTLCHADVEKYQYVAASDTGRSCIVWTPRHGEQRAYVDVEADDDSSGAEAMERTYASLAHWMADDPNDQRETQLYTRAIYRVALGYGEVWELSWNPATAGRLQQILADSVG